MLQADGITGSVILPELNVGGRDSTTDETKEAGKGGSDKVPHGM